VKGLASYSSRRRQQCAPYLSKGRELMQKFLAPVNSDSFMLPLAR
jgi:hypothetical protein